jgi:hypothetical protein
VPRHRPRRIAGLLVLLGACKASAQPEGEASCTVLCSPTLELEPTLSIGNIVAAPLVQDVTSGERQRLPVDPVIQATLALGIPTEVPWLAITLETIYSPFVTENDVEFEAELNLRLVDSGWTGGWVGAHADVIDQISPRARPGASVNTHKLDLEVDVAFYPFNWTPPTQWIHHAALEASFDYLATGLPRRGDVMDGKLYLDDASGWSLSLLVVIPLAPLHRS